MTLQQARKQAELYGLKISVAVSFENALRFALGDGKHEAVLFDDLKNLVRFMRQHYEPL